MSDLGLAACHCKTAGTIVHLAIDGLYAGHIVLGDVVKPTSAQAIADLGIAMGAMGSDAAIEAADVVLMDDDPLKIGKAVRISRKCLRIVWQNIVMALGIKGICLVLGIFGIVNMWLAIFADVGVMILAVLNAIRAMYVRKT